MSNKTLFDLTYETAVALGVVEEGTATGGSTTTIIDTVERDEADDFYNGGTAWILYDAGGAGAAPQGEFSFVTDQVQSTSTLTLRSTLTAAVASGDKYAVARTRYPLSLLISKINEVIRGIALWKDDITTITIAADQTEYSLPSDVWQVKEVWLQLNVSDTNDTRPTRIYDYEIQKSATGTANKLVLKRQFTTGDILKVSYLAYHATLRAATDKLDDTIHANRVVYNAVVACLLWRKAKIGQLDENENQRFNYFQAKATEENSKFLVSYPKKSAKTIHLTFSRP